MDVTRPTSLDDALETLARRRAVPVAGATDLLVGWHEREHRPEPLLDLSALRAELGGWRLTPDRLELGALCTFWELRCAPQVAAEFPLLPLVAAQVGSVQIQTRGTWAGNVANGSPAADGVAVLMAYDAQVVLASSGGRRTVPLDEFYTGYRRSVRRDDELIVALHVPRRRHLREWFEKVGPRRAQAITKVGAALVQFEQGWRVVANSVAETVRRCRALEAALDAGRRFATPREVQALLAQDISPIDDVRSTARYRGTVLARIIYYWLAQ